MKKLILILTILCFLITSVYGTSPVYAQEFRLPTPGVRVGLSPEYNSPILKGLKVHTENPFRLDFILDQGDSSVFVGKNSSPLEGGARGGRDLKQGATKLIKYFLASLTIPEKDLWVNLSPYEKDRIIPQSFGLTEMGRDLLAEDYMLKQITASLVYPEGEIGKKFWKRIYEKTAKIFGSTNIPVNTFNKVWIVPEKAMVYENAQAGTAYVVESKLKVMLEQDYLALSKNQEPTRGHISERRLPNKDTNSLASQIVHEIVIPELIKEVNEGRNFAQLRQVYNSLILATWYKKKIKDSILAQVYADKNKVAGVGYDQSVIPAPPTRGGQPGDMFNKEQQKNVSPSTLPSEVVLNAKAPQGNNQSPESSDVQLIYQRYLQAFKKGVYNYIKDEINPTTQENVPRKYFSGGTDLALLSNRSTSSRPQEILRVTTDAAMLDKESSPKVVVNCRIDQANPAASLLNKTTKFFTLYQQALAHIHQDKVLSSNPSWVTDKPVEYPISNKHGDMLNIVHTVRMVGLDHGWPILVINVDPHHDRYNAIESAIKPIGGLSAREIKRDASWAFTLESINAVKVGTVIPADGFMTKGGLFDQEGKIQAPRIVFSLFGEPLGEPDDGRRWFEPKPDRILFNSELDIFKDIKGKYASRLSTLDEAEADVFGKPYKLSEYPGPIFVNIDYDFFSLFQKEHDDLRSIKGLDEPIKYHLNVQQVEQTFKVLEETFKRLGLPINDVMGFRSPTYLNYDSNKQWLSDVDALFLKFRENVLNNSQQLPHREFVLGPLRGGKNWYTSQRADQDWAMSNAQVSEKPWDPKQARFVPDEEQAGILKELGLEWRNGKLYYGKDFKPLRLKSKIIFIRHGDTHLIEEGKRDQNRPRYQGNVDDPFLNQLSTHGENQALSVVDKLQGILKEEKKPIHYFRSPLFRAFQTAQPAMEAMHFDFEGEPREGLAEMSFGEFENKSDKIIEEKMGPLALKVSQAYRGYNAAVSVGGGDDFIRFLEQSKKELEDLDRLLDGDTGVFFSHGTRGAAFKILLGKVDQSKFIDWRKEIPPTAVPSVLYDPAQFDQAMTGKKSDPLESKFNGLINSSDITEKIIALAAKRGYWGHGVGVHLGESWIKKDRESKKKAMLNIILDQKIKKSFLSFSQMMSLMAQSNMILGSMIAGQGLLSALNNFIENPEPKYIGTVLKCFAFGVASAAIGLSIDDRYYGPFGNKRYIKTFARPDIYGPYWVMLDRTFKAPEGKTYGEFILNAIKDTPNRLKRIPYRLGIKGDHHLAYLFPDEDLEFFQEGIRQALQNRKINEEQANDSLRRLITYSEFIRNEGDIDEIFTIHTEKYVDYLRAINPVLAAFKGEMISSTITWPLRYPALYDLLLKSNDDNTEHSLKVALMGPGMYEKDGVSESPQLFEVMSVLSAGHSKRPIELAVISKDEGEISKILKMTTGESENETYTLRREWGRYHISDRVQSSLKKFLRNEQKFDAVKVRYNTVVPNNVDIQPLTADFKSLDYGEDQLDLMIGTFSLTYALAQSPQSTKLFSKFVKALKPKGRLLVDVYTLRKVMPELENFYFFIEDKVGYGTGDPNEVAQALVEPGREDLNKEAVDALKNFEKLLFETYGINIRINFYQNVAEIIRLPDSSREGVDNIGQRIYRMTSRGLVLGQPSKIEDSTQSARQDQAMKASAGFYNAKFVLKNMALDATLMGSCVTLKAIERFYLNGYKIAENLNSEPLMKFFADRVFLINHPYYPDEYWDSIKDFYQDLNVFFKAKTGVLYYPGMGADIDPIFNIKGIHQVVGIDPLEGEDIDSFVDRYRATIFSQGGRNLTVLRTKNAGSHEKITLTFDFEGIDRQIVLYRADASKSNPDQIEELRSGFDIFYPRGLHLKVSFLFFNEILRQLSPGGILLLNEGGRDKQTSEIEGFQRVNYDPSGGDGLSSMWEKVGKARGEMGMVGQSAQLGVADKAMINKSFKPGALGKMDPTKNPKENAITLLIKMREKKLSWEKILRRLVQYTNEIFDKSYHDYNLVDQGIRFFLVRESRNEGEKNSLDVDIISKAIGFVYIILDNPNSAKQILDKIKGEDAFEKNDKAMNVFQKGGIDLTPANMNLQTQNSNEGIKFRIDPAMLQKLQNAPGFVPVIVNIQPMMNLKDFLGVVQTGHSQVYG
ncbi:MAG: histidine phosphatase family protein [Candidatus Omnitrophica bacterium]|nr:histidine phosphatase family protein [Candidatus Omnitrophota bacterium]